MNSNGPSSPSLERELEEMPAAPVLTKCKDMLEDGKDVPEHDQICVPHEVRSIAAKFKIHSQAVVAAIRTVGVSREKVYAHIRRKQEKGGYRRRL